MGAHAIENYLFKIADQDNDGKISPAEAVAFFQGFGLPHHVAQQIFMGADRHRSGFLGRPEFFHALTLVTVYMAQNFNALTPEIVKAAFHGPIAPQIPAPQINPLWRAYTPQATPTSAMPQFANLTIPPYSQMGSWSDRQRNLAMNHQILPASSSSPFQALGVTQGLSLSLPSSSSSPLQALKPHMGSQGSMLPREQVEESQNALLKELYLSKSQLYLLQEENKKLQEERDNAVKEVEILRDGAGRGSCEAFSKFSMLELQQATENFNNSHMIGKGGFGCVYKGSLHNTMVAIKKLDAKSLQGKPEFEQEVAILSTIRHPNLVTLIGTCSEISALVYEYLPNGSLEDRLACKDRTQPLTWQVRTRIIGEIYRALLFLQSNNPNPIVHGDLNPSNILLDANLVSKLSDFGISRLLIKSDKNTLVYSTENPKGTFAYMDPEYFISGQITVKSDVYSFGIIILRLLTGKPPKGIIAFVKHADKANSLHSIIDKSAGEWPFVQAKQLTHLGLRCTHIDRRKRPDLESEWKLVESLTRAASLSVMPSFKSQLDDKDVPSYFMCPIFHEVMKDPHIAADGYTYESEAIKGWLEGGNQASPMTNLPLDHLKLTPNCALRSAIQEWLQQYQ